MTHLRHWLCTAAMVLMPGFSPYQSTRLSRYNAVPELSADMRQMDIIVTGGTAAVIAAKQATSVIPIIFASVGDPIGNNLVASLARPDGNVTGLSAQSADLAGKRVELLREVIPDLRRWRDAPIDKKCNFDRRTVVVCCPELERVRPVIVRGSTVSPAQVHQ
jgi:ABC transporter substrate binding protein